MASKKHIALCVLQILKEYSDEDHILTAREIRTKLFDEYGIELAKNDNRTIRNAIDDLVEDPFLKYNISKYSKDSRGYYYIKDIDKDLTVSQVQILSDAVCAFPFVSESETGEIRGKLLYQLNERERKAVKNLSVMKPNVKIDDYELSYKMDILTEAISGDYKVRFDYYTYGTDKKLHKREKKSGKGYLVNPYGLIYSSDHYYLACTHYQCKDMVLYRLDLIQNVTIDKHKRDAREKTFSCKKIIEKVVDGYLEPIAKVKLTISKANIGHVIYKFGKDIKIEDLDDNRCKVTLETSKEGIKSWALRCIDDVEILEPSELRQEVMGCIARNRYGV